MFSGESIGVPLPLAQKLETRISFRKDLLSMNLNMKLVRSTFTGAGKNRFDRLSNLPFLSEKAEMQLPWLLALTTAFFILNSEDNLVHFQKH